MKQTYEYLASTIQHWDLLDSPAWKLEMNLMKVFSLEIMSTYILLVRSLFLPVSNSKREMQRHPKTQHILLSKGSFVQANIWNLVYTHTCCFKLAVSIINVYSPRIIHQVSIFFSIVSVSQALVELYILSFLLRFLLFFPCLIEKFSCFKAPCTFYWL